LDPEREATFRPVAVARDHAPEDLVTARRQRGHAHLEQGAVLGVDARIPVVDPPPVAALDAERAEHGLDRPVEPDADRARRVHRVPHARLRMVGKRVSPRRGRREQEQGRQQPRAHYPTGEGPNGPLRDLPGARTKITGSSPTGRYRGCVGPRTPLNGAGSPTSRTKDCRYCRLYWSVNPHCTTFGFSSFSTSTPPSSPSSPPSETVMVLLKRRVGRFTPKAPVRAIGLSNPTLSGRS